MSLTYKLTGEDFTFCRRVVCAGFHAIKDHTLQVVEALLDEGVPGDFAECGVLFGAHPAIMLYALKRRGITDRKVRLFDSFQGIPRATAADPPDQQKAYGVADAAGGALESSGISVSSIDNTIRNLRSWGVYDPKLIEVHAGWFQDSLPSVAPTLGPLALLRVDVDLYESTKVVYRHLYDKVVPGGYVIDDDWGAPSDVTACRRAALEALGPLGRLMADVQHVEGQETTACWRKR